MAMFQVSQRVQELLLNDARATADQLLDWQVHQAMLESLGIAPQSALGASQAQLAAHELDALMHQVRQ